MASLFGCETSVPVWLIGVSLVSLLAGLILIRQRNDVDLYEAMLAFCLFRPHEGSMAIMAARGVCLVSILLVEGVGLWQCFSS